MLDIPDLAGKWGHIFGGVNQIDVFRGQTLKTRADTISADYTTAAEQRIAADGLYSQILAADLNFESTIQFFFNMAKNTLLSASINDVDFPTTPDEDTLINKLIQDMVNQSQTFQLPTITINGLGTMEQGTPVPAVRGAPYGNGVIVTTVTEPRTGVSRYYTYAETISCTCAADSYVDGVQAGQETFLVQSFASVDFLNSQWPKGSGINTTYQSSTGATSTLIANSYFEDWDQTIPDTILNWTLVNLTPSTDFFKSTDPYTGVYAVRLTGAGAGAELKQNVVNLIGDKNYAFGIRIKRPNAVTGGIITVTLRNPDGTVLTDILGNQISIAIALTGAEGNYILSWTVFNVPPGFQTPISFSIRVTTAIPAGQSVLIDTVVFSQMINLYTGGPDIAFFPGNKAWARADKYKFDIATSATKASFVKLMDRLYNVRAREVDLPVATTPTISDGLIT